MPERILGPLALPHIVACAARDRTKDSLRRALTRRRARLAFARTDGELIATLQTTLVDAVIVDLGQANDETWALAAVARDFPSIPFFAYAALRPGELPSLARAWALEFTDCIAEGLEDDLTRELIAPSTFTVRFATALRGAEARLGLTTPLQREAWKCIVAQGGRTVRTDAIAEAVGLTREHLSRRFSAAGAPNLKRVIDLVRVLAAAELAKNPGYDLPDIARVLEFASASHLNASCQRLVGVKSVSLARLRPVDLMDRFVKQGRGRSRS